MSTSGVGCIDSRPGSAPKVSVGDFGAGGGRVAKNADSESDSPLSLDRGNTAHGSMTLALCRMGVRGFLAVYRPVNVQVR